jgi:hypothetical protein
MQIKRAHAARIESRRDGPARLTLRCIIINAFVIISRIADRFVDKDEELCRTERDDSRGYRGLQGSVI